MPEADMEAVLMVKVPEPIWTLLVKKPSRHRKRLPEVEAPMSKLASVRGMRWPDILDVPEFRTRLPPISKFWETEAEPMMSSFVVGEVVPMPTFPCMWKKLPFQVVLKDADETVRFASRVIESTNSSKSRELEATPAVAQVRAPELLVWRNWLAEPSAEGQG